MRPLAEKLLNAPLPRAEISHIRELLAGCQYFDASPLQRVYEIRNSVDTPTQDILGQLLEVEIPARSTWLEMSPSDAVIISNKPSVLRSGSAYTVVVVRTRDDGSPYIYQSNIGRNGFVSLAGSGSEAEQRAMSRAIRWVYFTIEAMQTPGGFTHCVDRRGSRQQGRAALRAGRPVHKWVEIRLGRARATAGSGSAGDGQRGVAWHYRRAHAINHPNPKYPHWRKGGWVGSPDFGIRSHDYIVVGPEGAQCPPEGACADQGPIDDQ